MTFSSFAAKYRNFLLGLLSCGILIIIWFILAEVIGSSFILPSPVMVFRDGIKLIGEADFLKTLGATCMRGLQAFIISFFLSCFLGSMAGIFPSVSAFLKPWMSVIKSTPVVSFILIAIFWFGSSFVPVFISILMTLPIMTGSIEEGIKNTDKKLLQMSEVYNMPGFNRFFYIRLPSTLPYLLAGAGSSLGLTWKVVIAGEILAFPPFGLGSAMQTAKVHLETSRVFSLTLVAIILSIITEAVFTGIVHFATRRYTSNADNKS
ncbi:ABC transporter permease subunit [Brucepastera parasyntrophica]|uniref:ABC transporter permease n=1 Tax=Brucepastera parasyntrophica TaxID=2880008 RepID=UPI00210CBD27|nr:ABC transporter permease subunit [Brucepastera parasyntrophica]ULQ59994.1 ABC transporter permease subunit [Brucepastera parasyntrophica]